MHPRPKGLVNNTDGLPFRDVAETTREKESEAMRAQALPDVPAGGQRRDPDHWPETPYGVMPLWSTQVVTLRAPSPVGG